MSILTFGELILILDDGFNFFGDDFNFLDADFNLFIVGFSCLGRVSTSSDLP